MRNKEFYQGLALAFGTVARNGYGGIAVDAMDGNGITLMDLESSGAEEFDLKPIRDEYRLQCRNSNGHTRKRSG